MAIKLVVSMVNSAEPMSEHTFDKEVITIGRTMGNDVVLPDVEKKVSSKHAKIENAGGAYQLVDVGSVNKTFLNGRKLESNHPVPIRNADQIGIGSFQITFTTTEETKIDVTKPHVDPTRSAEKLADAVAAEYAKRMTAPPEERRAAMREVLREGVRVAGHGNERAVLSLVRTRFSAVAAAAGPASPEQPHVSVATQEQLYRAGHQACSNLSTHFLGDANFESAEQVLRFAQQIEQALETTFEWVANCLKGRKEFENQFSADLTMVFSKEGNPLKTAGSPKELGRHLIDWRASRDLGKAKGLLESAFKDLTMHQLGLLAGVQDCIKAVLQRLDPKKMEDSVSAKGGLFSTFNKAEKAWNTYKTMHAELFQENSKVFNELIYPNIRKGYLASNAPEGKTPPPTGGATPPPSKGDAK